MPKILESKRMVIEIAIKPQYPKKIPTISGENQIAGNQM